MNAFVSLAANDPCNPDPCKNKGKCQVLPLNTYYCICVEGWTGVNCEQGEFNRLV